MDKSDFEKTLSMIREKCHKGANNSLEKILSKHYTTKSVLGIDLYKYSKYLKNAQTFIPYLVHLIYEDTVYGLNRYEATFFEDYDQAKFKESFVDTGDGGFILFDTPFHALFFAIYFAFNILRYNTKKLRPEIYEVVGPISLRYALTQDDTFQFDSNWYGPAIITCSRILSRDKLNRFLIDESVKTWFDLYMNGIETMVCLGLNNLKDTPVYDLIVQQASPYTSILMLEEGDNPGKSNIMSTNLSKIGTVKSKGDVVSVYSLHLQSYLVVASLSDPDHPQKYVVTIGNLNTSGL